MGVCRESSQELKQRARISRRFLAELGKKQQTGALNFGARTRHPQWAPGSGFGEI